MTGKLLSLSKVHKARERLKKRAQADENAVKFGRSKTEKQRDTALARKAARGLDGKKRE